jgi:predicted DNA-binding transcriptional regulator AlpA
LTTPFLFARNKYSADQLITMKEIADISGVSYWYVRALACGSENSKAGFPEPVAKIGRRKVWLREDIQKWNEQR